MMIFAGSFCIAKCLLESVVFDFSLWGNSAATQTHIFYFTIFLILGHCERRRRRWLSSIAYEWHTSKTAYFPLSWITIVDLLKCWHSSVHIYFLNTHYILLHSRTTVPRYAKLTYNVHTKGCTFSTTTTIAYLIKCENIHLKSNHSVALNNMLNPHSIVYLVQYSLVWFHLKLWT